MVWPESEEDCQAVVNLAGEHDACLIPYGGGTNVSNALLVPEGENRMVVSLDIRRMNPSGALDRRQPDRHRPGWHHRQPAGGIAGQEGLTCGHEPDSIELSTLGGWIATNASGMKKNRYGNIEDLVENVTLVTPPGWSSTCTDAPPVGRVELQKALFGSEGNLGLITRAVITIHKLPEVKKYGSAIFADWNTGVSFMAALNQTGAKPASIRLVDNLQFRLGQSLKPAPTGRRRCS